MTVLFFAQMYFNTVVIPTTQSPISTILFRIPMDVSQLDKSDSESESDWWTFHTQSQQKQEAEGLIKTSSTLNCNHMPSIIHTSHQMQRTLCKGYPSDVRFSVFRICEVINIRFWLWQFCFFFSSRCWNSQQVQSFKVNFVSSNRCSPKEITDVI